MDVLGGNTVSIQKRQWNPYIKSDTKPKWQKVLENMSVSGSASPHKVALPINFCLSIVVVTDPQKCWREGLLKVVQYIVLVQARLFLKLHEMNYSHSWVFKATRSGCFYILLNTPFQKDARLLSLKFAIYPAWTPLSSQWECCKSPPPPCLSQRRMQCWLFSSQQESPLINMIFLRLVSSSFQRTFSVHLQIYLFQLHRSKDTQLL